MKSLKATLLAAVAVATAVPAAAQEMTQIDVIMPIARSTNFFPLLVGEALGYFEEEGITVNLLPSSTNIPYVAFVQNGQADLAMLDAPQTFQAANAGADVKVVYEAMQRAPEGIGVLGESPYQSVADLKGTTVGLVADRDRTTLAIALETQGLTIDDVETAVVGEGGAVQANALRNETVSAISGAVPDWLALQASGMEIRLITPAEVKETPANNFVVSTTALEESREDLEGFFRAWSKGMYAGTLDIEVIAAISKAAVPFEWENEEFGQEFLDASIEQNVSVTEQLGDLQPEVWEAVQPPMVKQKVIDEVIDPSTFLDDSLIEAANDFDRAEVEAEIAAWKEANM